MRLKHCLMTPNEKNFFLLPRSRFFSAFIALNIFKKRLPMFDKNELEAEKMKIKLEKNIKTDGLNEIQKVQLDEVLTKEAKSRIVARDARTAEIESLKD